LTHVLLDLDDTLYREARVGDTVREHIVDYVAEHLSLPRDRAAALTSELYASHGTTMAGLAAVGHSIEPDHWHGRVHAPLDYEALLSRDEALVGMLSALTRTRTCCVFTNADRRHMDACLRLLGATGGDEEEQGGGVRWSARGHYYFENVQALGAERGLLPVAGGEEGSKGKKGFLAKPSADVFRMVSEHCGAVSPRACVFVDDSPRNVAAAKAVGMYSVLVGRRRGETVEGADACVETVLELPEVLPELFVALEGAVVGQAAAAAAEAAVAAAAGAASGEKDEVGAAAVAVAVAVAAG